MAPGSTDCSSFYESSHDGNGTSGCVSVGFLNVGVSPTYATFFFISKSGSTTTRMVGYPGLTSPRNCDIADSAVPLPACLPDGPSDMIYWVPYEFDVIWGIPYPGRSDCDAGADTNYFNHYKVPSSGCFNSSNGYAVNFGHMYEIISSAESW